MLDLNIFNWYGPDFLNFYILLGIVVFITDYIIAYYLRPPYNLQNNENIPSLDIYEIGFLAGKEKRIINASLAKLLHLKIVQIDNTNKAISLIKNVELEDDPLSSDIVKFLSSNNNELSISNIYSSFQGSLNTVKDSLIKKQLVIKNTAIYPIIAMQAITIIFLLGVGLNKLIIGMSRNRPVGYLSMLLFLYLIIGIVVLGISGTLFRTIRGNHIFKKLKNEHLGLESSVESNATNISGNDIMLGVELFSETILSSTSLSDLYLLIHPPSTSSSGGFDSCSSCSSCGGGCGGGCGGCGGI